MAYRSSPSLPLLLLKFLTVPAFLAYCHAAQRLAWPAALAIACLVWALLAGAIAQVPP